MEQTSRLDSVCEENTLLRKQVAELQDRVRDNEFEWTLNQDIICFFYDTDIFLSGHDIQ